MLDVGRGCRGCRTTHWSQDLSAVTGLPASASILIFRPLQMKAATKFQNAAETTPHDAVCFFGLSVKSPEA